MRVWAFLVLMLVTVVTVVAAAELAERWFAPGFERGIVIAVIAGLVVFPLSRWFEHKGWVKGAWRPGADGRPATDAPIDPQGEHADQATSGSAGRQAGDFPDTILPRPASGPASDLPSRRASSPAAHEPRSPTGDAR